MKLSPLIKDQDVFIDAHGHENEDIQFADERYDIHLHKKTNYRVDGKIQEVNIRIPLNSNRPITISNARNKRMEVPRRLQKEINGVFEENKEIRIRFVEEVRKILEEYYHVFWDKEFAKQVLRKISYFFDLNWDEEDVIFTASKGDRTPYSMYQADFVSREYPIRLEMDWQGILIKNIRGRKEVTVIRHGVDR